VRVFASERKVLYRRVSPSPAALPFEADVPLAPGINVLRVIARDRNDVTSTRTFIVRRDGPQGEPLTARPPAVTD
jgi:carboxyl-terminal processing protease